MEPCAMTPQDAFLAEYKKAVLDLLGRCGDLAATVAEKDAKLAEYAAKFEAMKNEVEALRSSAPPSE